VVKLQLLGEFYDKICFPACSSAEQQGMPCRSFVFSRPALKRKRQGKGVRMKRFAVSGLMVSLLLAMAAGSCHLAGEPGVSAGAGTLVISLGSGSGEPRAITNGTDLPAETRAALRYQLTLTGPGNEVLEKTLTAGEGSLTLTIAVGEWSVDAKAWFEDGLAGTGSHAFTVTPGPNSVRVPMKINHGYFDITLPPAASTRHGAVTASFPAAFPGTTITLTVTPDPGYMLKAGTLKYHDGSDHPVSGPPYTFPMPEADATISAEFKPEDNAIIALETDRTVTVTAEHSAGHTPPTEISWSADESVTFTLDSSGYTADAKTLKWFVNNEEKPGTGNSLVIKAKDYMKRQYTLTVMVKQDNQWYSTETGFTVTE
jgi:hypothetical protein